jgi:hypothetical protein
MNATNATKPDPLINAYGRNWEILFTKPLSQIEGMAWGVREDYENGNTSIRTNWCISKNGSSDHVYAWAPV